MKVLINKVKVDPRFHTDSKQSEPLYYISLGKKGDYEEIYFDDITREIKIRNDHKIVKREDLKFLYEHCYLNRPNEESILKRIKEEYGIE